MSILNLFSILIMISVAVFEYLLHKRWNATYWRVGLPLYKASFQSTVHRDTTVAAQILTKQNEYSEGQRLEYHQLSDSEIAFVERPDSNGMVVRRSHLMHGMIQVSNSDNMITVVGRTNWFPLLLSIFLVVNWLTLPSSGYRPYIGTVGWAVMLVALYAIQLATFRKVTAIAREYFAGR